MAWGESRRNYKPYFPFSVTMKLLIPTETKAKGTTVKTFPDPEEGILFYGSFRTFGGTERIVNDVLTIIDTATIDTWFRPDITSDCRVYICETGVTYDILSTPEDINMRHQYMQFKVRKVGGKP